jgi:GTP cyclohydrolase II
MEQEGKGNGHLALMESKVHKAQGMKQADAYEAAGFQRDARDFRPAAEILQDLGVKSIRMITNNVKKVETLTRYGVVVVGTQGTD